MEQSSTAPPSVTDILEDLNRTRFYGTLEIKFEAGRVVMLRKTQTIKPIDSNNYPNTGGNEIVRRKNNNPIQS